MLVVVVASLNLKLYDGFPINCNTPTIASITMVLFALTGRRLAGMRNAC